MVTTADRAPAAVPAPGTPVWVVLHDADGTPRVSGRVVDRADAARPGVGLLRPAPDEPAEFLRCELYHHEAAALRAAVTALADDIGRRVAALQGLKRRLRELVTPRE